MVDSLFLTGVSLGRGKVERGPQPLAGRIDIRAMVKQELHDIDEPRRGRKMERGVFTRPLEVGLCTALQQSLDM